MEISWENDFGKKMFFGFFGKNVFGQILRRLNVDSAHKYFAVWQFQTPTISRTSRLENDSTSANRRASRT